MAAMRYTLFFLFVLFAAHITAFVRRPKAREGDHVLVTIENGALRGVVARSLNGTLYNRFVGIPFATPPVGDLRFRAPQPPANWSGVRDALSFGPKCPQLSSGSEDCLFVNVYVPVTSDLSPLPVMFNIYGGGFSGGSSDGRRPDYFMDKGVVLVTFNYRVASIGFLSLQNDDIPGNAGLKDQLFALQWVQRNIGAFGGDPNRVTIFGESAGGASSSFMFLSPAAKGLFSGAIMESGVATASWAVQQSPRESAYWLGTSLGFQPEGGSQEEEDARLAAFLRSVDHSQLTGIITGGDSSNTSVGFFPVIEPPSYMAVLTESPLDIVREGRYNQVPIMVGVTSAEGALFVDLFGMVSNKNVTEVIKTAFIPLVAGNIQLPTEEERIEAAKQVENFYFGEQGFNADNPQTVYDVFSDVYYIQPADSFATKVANTSNLPVFFYYFDYDGYGASEYGMFHAMTSSYLFVHYILPGPNKDPNSNDGKVTDLITTLWTNFGKYLNPTPSGSPVKWDKYMVGTYSYLDMKKEFETRQFFLQERMDFWRKIVP